MSSVYNFQKKAFIICPNKAIATHLAWFLTKIQEHVAIRLDTDLAIFQDEDSGVYIASDQSMNLIHEMGKRCKPKIANLWIIEPFPGILERLDYQVARSYATECRLASFMRIMTNRSNWVRLNNAAQNPGYLAFIVSKILRAGEVRKSRPLELPVNLCDEFIEKLEHIKHTEFVPEIKIDEKYFCKSGASGDLLLAGGWNDSENEHVWSKDHFASICFKADCSNVRNANVQLEIQTLEISNSFFFYMNNVPIFFIKVENCGNIYTVDLPTNLPYVPEAISFFKIDIRSQYILRPADINPSSTDTRTIGLGIRSIKLMSHNEKQVETQLRFQYSKTIPKPFMQYNNYTFIEIASVEAIDFLERNPHVEGHCKGWSANSPFLRFSVDQNLSSSDKTECRDIVISYFNVHFSDKISIKILLEQQKNQYITVLATSARQAISIVEMIRTIVCDEDNIRECRVFQSFAVSEIIRSEMEWISKNYDYVDVQMLAWRMIK